MLDFFYYDFLFSCSLMALGIGIDASMATALQARYLNSKLLMLAWIGGVTLTHTVFPMIGYISSYQSLNIYPSLTAMVGILAFALIAVFLYQELLSLMHDDDSDALSASGFLANVGILLAVSWDALWSGPAKSAQVVDWPETTVWLSFAVVGFIILIMTSLALRFAQVIQMSSRAAQNVMRWLQYSVVAYFGLLAITRYTFEIYLDVKILALMSCFIMAACMWMTVILPLDSARLKSTA